MFKKNEEEYEIHLEELRTILKERNQILIDNAYEGFDVDSEIENQKNER